MALKMDVTAEPLTLVIKDAYIRIEQAQLNRFEAGVACVARCYQSAPSFPPTIPAFKDMSFTAPYDAQGGDIYAQAYAGAKLLPQFAGATDC